MKFFLLTLFLTTTLAANETYMTTPSPLYPENSFDIVSPDQILIRPDGLYYESASGTLERIEMLISHEERSLFVRKVKKCRNCDRPLTCNRCYNPDCPLFRKLQTNDD